MTYVPSPRQFTEFHHSMKVCLNPKSYLQCTHHTIKYISSDQLSFLNLIHCLLQLSVCHYISVVFSISHNISISLSSHDSVIFHVQVVSEPPCYSLVVFCAISTCFAVNGISVSVQGITHSPPLHKSLPSQRWKFVKNVLAAIIILTASSSLLLYFPYVSFIGCHGSS